MHTSASSETTAANPSSEIIETLPIAAALFSDDGFLLSCSPQFRRAMRLGDGTRDPEGAEGIRARLLEASPDRAILLRHGGIPQKANARRLDGGQLLVWLEEEAGEAVHRRRSEFLSIASHDLRGSMANSRSYASLLLSPRMELSERARHCAEVIQRNADRALRLLGECFDLFLYRMNALDLDCAPGELNEVFDEVVRQARALAAARGARLVVEIPPALPAMSVDRGRLTQAALAFVAHSLSRVGRGQPVHLVVQRQHHSILVEVSDEEGIASPDGASAIYDAEARAIAEGKLGEGFHLGLARATIEAHGGEVGVRTGEGSGSTFLFTLPLDREQSPGPYPPPALPQ